VYVQNGLLLGKAPEDYLLHALRSVRAADLEQVSGGGEVEGQSTRSAAACALLSFPLSLFPSLHLSLSLSLSSSPSLSACVLVRV
jgi:hypothetical protein